MTDVIGIEQIGVALPAGRRSAAAQAPRLHIEPDRLERRLGFHGLARKRDDQDTSDLAIAAVEALVQRGLDLTRVQCLAVVTQNPDGGGIPPVSAIIHGRLRLPTRVAAFDVAHGCAGFVYGLAITKAFMEAQGFRTGLLVTADPYSKIVDPDDTHTALIFGDAASATLLGPDYRWAVGRTDFGTAGDQREALRIEPNGRLHMNGKRIARMCATVVPRSIHNALALNDATIAEMDVILLHQGSRYIVETIGDALGARDKTPFFAAAYGNVVSSSLPIGLAQHVPDSVERLVASGFGVGLSWASTVLTRRKRD